MNFIQKRSNENFKKAGGAYNFGFRLFQMEDKNKKYHGQLLSEVYLDTRVHFIKGMPPSICNMIYFDKDDPEAKCDMCDMPHPKYKTQPAWLQRHYLAYIFELLGKKGKTKKDVEYDMNPEVILALPSFGKCKNFKPFLDAVEEEENGLLSVVWNFEESSERGFEAPSKFTNFKKLGDQYNPDVVKELQAKYAAMSEAEIYSLLLAPYANVQWDHPDMREAGLKNPYPKDGEAPEGDKKPSLDD